MKKLIGKINKVAVANNLIKLLKKFVNSTNHEKENISVLISDYCQDILLANEKVKNKLPLDLEEILESCLDLNHWGDEDIPPTLTIKEIKVEIIPQLKKIAEIH